MNDTTQLAIEAALANMAQRGWVDICTVDKVLKATGRVPDREAYDALHLLHCVHFKDMRPELRAELPGLFARVLGGEPINLFDPPKRKDLTVATVEPQEAPSVVRRLLAWGAR